MSRALLAQGGREWSPGDEWQGAQQSKSPSQGSGVLQDVEAFKEGTNSELGSRKTKLMAVWAAKREPSPRDTCTQVFGQVSAPDVEYEKTGQKLPIMWG